LGAADDKFAKKIAEALDDVLPRKSAELRISIPTSHPRAQKLWRLACALASAQKLDNGIVVQRVAQPGATDDVLPLLRELVPGIDDMIQELLRAKAQFRAPSMLEVFKIAGEAPPGPSRGGRDLARALRGRAGASSAPLLTPS
jgi:hypothetical protein